MMKFVGMFLMNLSTTRIPACKAFGLFWLPVLLWAGSISPLRAAWGSHAVLPPMSGDSLSVAQDACLVELDRLFARIYACDDSQRRVVSDSFCRAAKQVLAQYAGLDFPFERIRNLSYFKAAATNSATVNWLNDSFSKALTSPLSNLSSVFFKIHPILSVLYTH